METSPRGPLVVKRTQGELRARVELLAKKRRSVKRKAQDPPESSLSARGKVPKAGSICSVIAWQGVGITCPSSSEEAGVVLFG